MQSSLTHSKTSQQYYQTHSHPQQSNQLHLQNNQEIIQQPKLSILQQQKNRPCQQFGLDPTKLLNQQLFKHRSYRRLYNIIANDQTAPEQIFRPNLIKQMYFLLQITPFIQPQLRDRFLDKIQQWYNSNDHKKIQLSKNLDGFVKNVLQGKKQEDKENQSKIKINNGDKIKRPKSSVQWDTSLNPFLRPYTAKIRNSGSNSQHKNKLRPQSSKYGLVSTMAQTNQQKNTFYKSTNMEPQVEQSDDNQQLYGNFQRKQETEMCDIEEEWERSQDFKKKYRTLHPEEEPTYEKLMGLISKFKQVDTNQNNRKIVNSSPFFRSNLVNNKRNIQSAIVKRQESNAKVLAQKQLNINKLNDNKQQNGNKNGNDSEDQDNIGKNDQEQYDNNEEDQNDENKINLDDRTGKFKSDARSRQGRKLRNKNAGNNIYALVNGVKILRPYTAKQTNIIYKLDQYCELEQNKKVIQSNQDEQCANKFNEYVRRKTMMKKQIVRRSQSKRYMDNFRNVVKILPSKTISPAVELNTFNNGDISTQPPPILQSASLQKKANQLCTNQSKQNNSKSVFDFSKIGGDNTGVQSPERPYYNVRTYFGDLKKKKISSSCRGIHKLQEQLHIQDQKLCNKMTHQKRLFSQQKFDPLHKTNLDNYNNQVLEQIQAIKKRFGGKITASTDALIKALYVNAPLPVQLPKTNGIASTRFTIPDKKYLMIQKQQKKKKRKLKKVKNSKSASKSRK